MNLQSLWRATLSLVLAAIVAACATVGTRTMTFSEADLARMLEQHGPFQRRLLEVLDVRVQHPSIRLMPESNRLASAFDVSATDRIGGRTLGGRIGIEYGLRYDEGDKVIRLTNVRVTTFQLNDVPADKRRGVQNLGALIAEHMLDDAVLYRFRPNDLKNAEGMGLKPGNVAVTSRGVEVTLAPVK
jgi:hypothetical protein